MQFYVVTSNLPGPGAGHFVAEKARELQDSGYVVGMVEELAQAADHACEFVELEDEHGHGQGPDSGITWSEHPTSANLKRLGPFEVASEVERQLRVLALEVDRINALGGRLESGEPDEGPGADGWPSKEACDIAFQVAERARRAEVAGDPASLRLRVCQRCGLDATIAARQAEPICNDHGLVGGHSYIDATLEQSVQVRRLRGFGWTVNIFGVRREWLLVDGTDCDGDRYRGHIASSGHFSGEPIDDMAEEGAEQCGSSSVSS